MAVPAKVYLGDSVYAAFDGYYIVLTTENDTNGPSNTILLESKVYYALVEYNKRIENNNVQPVE